MHQSGEALLLTVEQSADRLNISRAHLYREIQKGRIQTVSIGRARRISTAALENYVDALSAEAGAA